MPRIGAEPERKQALIVAAIDLIGERGSLDVPVKVIAQKAGMSSALAFHYFGGKDEIIIETMRYLLREYSAQVVVGLKSAKTPVDRLDAIICASFGSDQFDRKTIAAWLVFYLKAYSNRDAARLLAIYVGRLHSNLSSALRLIVSNAGAAERIAESMAALIDGLYIRHALARQTPSSQEAIAICRQHLRASLLSEGIEIPLHAIKKAH